MKQNDNKKTLTSSKDITIHQAMESCKQASPSSSQTIHSSTSQNQFLLQAHKTMYIALQDHQMPTKYIGASCSIYGEKED